MVIISIEKKKKLLRFFQKRQLKKIIIVYIIIMRFRNFCFTSFMTETPTFDSKYMQYICYQRERCPKTGNHHWQGYCELKCQLGMSRIKEIMQDEGLHIEKRYGSQLEAIEYCRKEESGIPNTFIELGTPKDQGERTDWKKLKDYLDPKMDIDRKSFCTILDEIPHLAVKYFFQIRAIQKLIDHKDALEKNLKMNETFKRRNKEEIEKLVNEIFKP